MTTSKKKSPETTRKSNVGTWSYLDPTTRQWVGTYTSRVLARAARAALKDTATDDHDTKDADVKSELQTDGEKKDVDIVPEAHVDSSQIESAPHDAAPEREPASAKDTTTMKVVFNKSDKARKSTSIVYTAANGLRGSLRVAKTFFKGGDAPASLEIDSDAFAEPKAKLTAAERKQARKDAPKLTPAQKLAKLQERAAKLTEKINAEAAAKAAEATPAQ